jgi:hypothetical protein
MAALLTSVEHDALYDADVQALAAIYARLMTPALRNPSRLACWLSDEGRARREALARTAQPGKECDTVI